MLQYKAGNIFDEDVEAIVNTVNCVGVMGRGLALQFKKTFPDNFKVYAAACKRNEVKPGNMFVYTHDTLLNPKHIINFPTKRHWRGKSRMEDIEIGLKDLCKVIKNNNIKTIAIPPLGSGLGGLNWGQVKEAIHRNLSAMDDVDIIVFEPKGSPSAQKMVPNKEVPKMTPGRAALIGLMRRYLNGLLDPFVSLIEIHKLMYFLQESGEPLKLKYKKVHYGPYADNLRHVLNVIEGHFVSGYADGGDDPTKTIELVPGAHEEAESFLKTKKQTVENFDKVSRLVDGFETPFGLELLATVHWVITYEGAASENEVVQKVHNWNNKKKRFTPRQILIAIKALCKHGWINKHFYHNDGGLQLA